MNNSEKKAFNKALLALAIPLALQNLLGALVGATDALMLGRLTQEAIAAVSLANQVSFVMSLFTMTVTGAAGVLIAQYWGKQDYARAKQIFGISVRYVGLISLVFFLLAYSFPGQLMRVFTPEQELIEIGASYLKIVSFSFLFNGLAQCWLMIMKISGCAKMSVGISAAMVAVDMIADLFLIYGYKDFAGLGANGSAYSTIAVEALALVWCLLWSCRKKQVRLSVGDIARLSRSLEGDFWRLVPGMLASSLLWGLSITMHSFILGRLGTDATAAASVTGVAQQLIQGLTHGFASGAAIMLGQKLGSGDLEGAKSYGERFWRVSAVSGIINVGLLCIVGPLVYVFYVLEPLAKSYLVQMLIMSLFYMFAYAYNTVFTCGVFPAGGDTKYDAISVFIATWCLALPLALLGLFVWGWPPMVVYVVMCLDEIVKAPFIRLRYNKYIWLRDLTRSQAAEGEEAQVL